MRARFFVVPSWPKKLIKGVISLLLTEYSIDLLRVSRPSSRKETSARNIPAFVNLNVSIRVSGVCDRVCVCVCVRVCVCVCACALVCVHTLSA